MSLRWNNVNAMFGGDGNSSDDYMMKMYFHGGFKEIILFDFWKTASVIVFVVSWFVLFIVSALYEGIKFLRETLIIQERISANDSQNESRFLSRSHIVQTFLHMFQVTISYLLMLAFMTYNSWLCMSVILGTGVGYFFFGYKRLTTIDANEHCH